MGGFAVDPEFLRGLSRRFSLIISDLMAASIRGEDLSDATAGGKDVASAVREFDDHWRRGTDQIEQNLKYIRTYFAEAAKAYESVDSSVAQAVSPGTAQGASSAPGGKGG